MFGRRSLRGHTANAVRRVGWRWGAIAVLGWFALIAAYATVLRTVATVRTWHSPNRPPQSPGSERTYPTPTIERSPNHLTRWTVYSDEKHGLRLRYPPNWTIRASTSQGYPYISWLDFKAQLVRQQRPAETHIDQGAMIELYIAPIVGYPLSDNSDGEAIRVMLASKQLTDPRATLKAERRLIGKLDGARSYLRSDHLWQDTFAFLAVAGRNTLLFELVMSIPRPLADRQATTEYLQVFEQMLATIEVTSSAPR